MFGNDVAVQYARTNAMMQYPAGSVLSVVTWGQQEDERWFGGKIPKRPKIVEFIAVTAHGTVSYARYEGLPLKKVSAEEVDQKDRSTYLMLQRAAVML